MISKLFISLLLFVQNEEIVKEQVSEFLQAEKVDSLSQLVTLLTIALITILALLTLNLYKVHQLKSEIKRLKNQ